MTELLGKLSSYNIFNYLFPGAVFSILAQQLSLFDVPDDIIQQVVWYYFIGMVMSRMGSILVEPILRKMKFITYSKYSDYLIASELDQKIETMVEVSNTYRTLATVFLALLVSSLFHGLLAKSGLDAELQKKVVIALLLALFILSFRKQVAYISYRVEHSSKGNK